MNKIVALHKEDLDVVVQPAVGWKELNEHLAPQGLFFPPDPSPDAKIGGMIAMSCSGTNAYRHGTMKEWVIALTVVLADGSVIKTRQRPRKSSAGFDLTRLMIGSEGTLGLVTEAVLKLTSAPTNLHVGVATFPDIQSAVRTGLSLTGSGMLIDALELLDAESMKAINMAQVSPITWQEYPTLFLKFSGSVNTVKDQIVSVEEAATQNYCKTFEVTDQTDLIETWWDARKAVGKALLAQKKDPSDVFLPSDAAVPVSRLADLMVESQKMLANAQMVGSVVGHLGDGKSCPACPPVVSDLSLMGYMQRDLTLIHVGNIHVVIVCSKDEKERGSNVISEIQRAAVKMEGTITGEHGIGLSLRDMLVYELGDETVDVMRRVRLSFASNSFFFTG
ncbi:MAG: hypothetical protein Q9160_007416 [Pyrenula sp. 1 TL-2023]